MLKQIALRIDQKLFSFTKENVFTNSLGLARSILAFSLLVTLLFNKMDTIFRPDGLGRQDIYGTILVEKINFFSLLPYSHIIYLKWIAIIILLVVISGWRPQITCILHFWINTSFINAATLIEGGDQVMTNLSFLLIPICLSDPRKNHWSTSELNNIHLWEERKLMANFFYFVIRLQVAFIYFHAALGKMPVTEWGNGTALYYWFNDPSFGMCEWMKPLLSPILRIPLAIALLTWSIIVLEFLLCIAIFLDAKWQKRLFYAGVTFHLFIIVIHGLFSFFISMLAALFLYLWPINKDIGKPLISKIDPQT